MISRFLALAMLLAWAPAEAQMQTVYKWTDASGITHFSTDPPPKGQAAERIQVSGGGSRAAAAAPRTASAGPTQNQRKCERLNQTLAQLLTVPGGSEQDPQWRAARDRLERDIAQSCS